MSGIPGKVVRAGWAIVTDDPRHYWSVFMDGLVSNHEDATLWTTRAAADFFIRDRGLDRVCRTKHVAEIAVELPETVGEPHA